MTAQIKDIQRELDAIQTKINAIDLVPLQAEYDAARVALAALKPAFVSAYVVSAEERALSAAATAADGALCATKDRLRDLTRMAQPLRAMLEAPARLAAAKADLGVLQSRAAEAAGVLTAAQATKTALAGLLADAEADHAGQVESAAKAVLAGAKAGKAIAGAPVDRGQVGALQSALAMAESELATAEARHAESLSDLAAGQRQLTQATIDAAQLRFELQLRDFVGAVCAFEFLGGEFDPADLHERCLVAQQNAAGLRDLIEETENAAG